MRWTRHASSSLLNMQHWAFQQYVCVVRWWLCTRILGTGTRTGREVLADHRRRSTGPTVDRFKAQHEESGGRFVLGLEGFRTNTGNTWRERKGDARAGPAVVGTGKRTSTALTRNRAGPSDEPFQDQHQETLDSVGRQVPVIPDQYDPESSAIEVRVRYIKIASCTVSCVWLPMWSLP